MLPIDSLVAVQSGLQSLIVCPHVRHHVEDAFLLCSSQVLGVHYLFIDVVRSIDRNTAQVFLQLCAPLTVFSFRGMWEVFRDITARDLAIALYIFQRFLLSW